MSDSDERAKSHDEDVEEDLFGDGDDDQLSEIDQAASDRESGTEQEDDSGDHDRGEDEIERDTFEVNVLDINITRHRTPKSADGKLYSLRVPPFLHVNPQVYEADTFEPSETDLSNSKTQTPVQVVRFRRDPETGKLQSNTNIYRWSDGSVTMAVGDEHYEIQNKSLAPPVNKYQERLDSNWYAAAAQIRAGSMVVVGHITDQYTIRPNQIVEDDALKKLADDLAQASRSSQAPADMFIRTTQDPELQKKQAEQAEKERERVRRRRENAAARLDGNTGRVGRGALSIGDLEGRRAAGASRKKGGAGGQRQKRRRPEYDSDDDLPQGSRRQDDYDLADGFIVASDEEISEEADEDEEDMLEDDDDEEEDEAPRTKRQRTQEPADEDADADGEPDDAPGPSTQGVEGRRARRRILDEDEDED